MKFNERKIAQMAAYLLRLRGGQMSKLKLMKLLYLAERESLRLYGVPMTGDRLVSMDHGPVLSKTLDLIRDTAIDAAEDGWNSLIMQKNVHDLELMKSVQDDDLDELSKADIDVLDSVWREFGHLDRWAVRDFTHTLKEWVDPDGTSLPIRYKDVFVACGYDEKQAMELSDHINDERAIDRIFESL